MRKELFETGKNVDSAIDSACEKLGCSREDCEWEIIDLPKKGFLGLKNTPAKVRVSIEIPDEKPKKAPEPEYTEKPKIEQKNVERPVIQQKQEIARQENKPREQKKYVQKEYGTFEKTKNIKKEPINPELISEKEKIAKEYLAEMMAAAGLKADYVITRERGGSCISINGDGLGMIIGRRGETLDAIQYLTGLVANRGEGDYLRLTVDCGDYRLKRKDTLEALAKKLAGQVLKTNVSKVLEPMNPFERRIIHATVSEIDGVSSSSVGDEPNRHVVITSPTSRPASRGVYRGDRRESEYGGYQKNRNPRRENHPVGENTDKAPGERPQKQMRDEGNSGTRGGYGRDRDRDRRGGNRGMKQSPPIKQGTPKQTPESEATLGISIGKIDLD